MITAMEAEEISFKGLMSLIKEAAEDGEYRLFLPYPISKASLDCLEKLGFTVHQFASAEVGRMYITHATPTRIFWK